MQEKQPFQLNMSRLDSSIVGCRINILPFDDFLFIFLFAKPTNTKIGFKLHECETHLSISHSRRHRYITCAFCVFLCRAGSCLEFARTCPTSALLVVSLLKRLETRLILIASLCNLVCIFYPSLSSTTLEQ